MKFRSSILDAFIFGFFATLGYKLALGILSLIRSLL